MAANQGVSYVVCSRAGTPSPFTDNEIGLCSKCSAVLQHRPDVPRVPLLCIECALQFMEEQGEGTIYMSEKQLQEALPYLKPQES